MFVPLLTKLLLLPLGVPPTPAMLYTKPFPRQRKLEGDHHHI